MPSVSDRRRWQRILGPSPGWEERTSKAHRGDEPGHNGKDGSDRREEVTYRSSVEEADRWAREHDHAEDDGRDNNALDASKYVPGVTGMTQ